MKYKTNREIELRAIRGIYGFQDCYFLEYRIPPKTIWEKLFDNKWRKIYTYSKCKFFNLSTPYDEWRDLYPPIMCSHYRGQDPNQMLNEYKLKFKTFGDICDFHEEQRRKHQEDKEDYNRYLKEKNKYENEIR